jgi:hypothetical protein
MPDTDLPWRIEIVALREVIEVQLNAIVETNRVFKNDLERVPTALQSAEARIQEVNKEKFQNIEAAAKTQSYHTTDTMLRVEKSAEVRMTSIEQQIAALRTEWITGHADLKDRVVRQEALTVGRSDSRSETRATIGMWAVVGALGFGVVTWFIGYNFRHDPGQVTVATVAPQPQSSVYAPPPGFALVPTSPAVPASPR